jgi:tRNA-binding protein
MNTAKPITDFSTFDALDIRAGCIVRAEPFPQARRPAIRLWIDFGDPLGIRASSAQITAHYTPDQLIGQKVMAVINFAPRQIGPFISQVLVLGFKDAGGSIRLACPHEDTPLGAVLH